MNSLELLPKSIDYNGDSFFLRGKINEMTQNGEMRANYGG